MRPWTAAGRPSEAETSTNAHRWKVRRSRTERKSKPARSHAAASFHFRRQRLRAVARWIADGKSNDSIAHLLGIRVEIVKSHLRVIYDKLGVDDRLAAALAILAQSAGGSFEMRRVNAASALPTSA